MKGSANLRFKDLIGFVADRLCYGMAPEEIAADLLAQGLTNEEAFLTFKAGEIIAKDREEHLSSR